MNRAWRLRFAPMPPADFAGGEALAERDGHWFPVRPSRGLCHIDPRYPFCVVCGVAFCWRWLGACTPPFSAIAGGKERVQ